MQTTSNVIDKNWKALIKPNKLDIISNEDNLLKECLDNLFKIIKPLPPLPSIRNKNFLVNISPENKVLKKALLKIGSTKIQETYVINDI